MRVLVLFTVCLVCVSAVPWKDCGSTSGVVKSVNVPSCPGKGACQLKRGTNVKFEIDFISNVQASSVSSVVHGVIHGVPLPFPLGSPDACKNCGLLCPLKPKQSNAYETSINVKHEYPALSLIVKWELKDQNLKDLVCIELPAQIV